MTARALVIHPGSLGDVLLAAPAVAHLRSLGFDPVLAAAPRIASFLAAAGLAAGALDLEALGLGSLFAGDPSPAARAALAGHEAVVSWMGAADETYRAALGRLGGPVVVAPSRPPAGERRHVADHLLATLAPLGPLPAWPPAVRLVPPAADQAWAEGWLAEHGLPPAGTVLVHAGAGSLAKAWPGFSGLVRRLTDDGAGVVLSVGPADGEQPGQAAPGRLAVARDLTLGRLAALAARTGAFVGNDSGPTHLAALVGCPTVAVFGSTDPARWAPRGPHVRVVGGVVGWPGLDQVAEAVALSPTGRGGTRLRALAAEVA